MRRASIVLSIWCASAAIASGGQTRWKTLCYPGFVESVDALAGPSATDCGMIDRHSGKVPAGRLQEAARCVDASLNGSQPFKFGTIPPESNVVYVLLRSAAGEIWQVRYERYIANKHLHENQFNQTCKHMTFDAAALIFQGVDCTLVSNGGLPTYDANTGH